jgi:predicted transport protein
LTRWLHQSQKLWIPVVYQKELREIIRNVYITTKKEEYTFVLVQTSQKTPKLKVNIKMHKVNQPI